MQQHAPSPFLGGPAPPRPRASTGSYQLPLPQPFDASPADSAHFPPGGSSSSSAAGAQAALAGGDFSAGSQQLLQRRHSAFCPRGPEMEAAAGRAGCGQARTKGSGGGSSGGADVGLPINFSHSRRPPGAGRGGRLCQAFLLLALFAAVGLCVMVHRTNSLHRAAADHNYVVRG